MAAMAGLAPEEAAAATTTAHRRHTTAHRPASAAAADSEEEEAAPAARPVPRLPALPLAATADTAADLAATQTTAAAAAALPSARRFLFVRQTERRSASLIPLPTPARSPRASAAKSRLESAAPRAMAEPRPGGR